MPVTPAATWTSAQTRSGCASVDVEREPAAEREADDRGTLDAERVEHADASSTELNSTPGDSERPQKRRS